MYYGKNERFLRIRFPMGWMIIFYFNWIYHSQDDHFYVVLLEYGLESKTPIEKI